MHEQEFSTRDLVGPLNQTELKNAPASLFVSGDISLLKEGRRVSVVGSRKASFGGMRRAEKLTRFLVSKKIIVVSGLAEGIDTVAHKTALELNHPTIAVLGNPLNQFYPAKNKDLQIEIAQKCLLVSQFPPGYPSKKENFPQRNRVMALLSDATVIVEAGEKSGTLHQGWEAIRLGRPLFILESCFEDPQSKWPREFEKYGALILSDKSRDDFEEALPEVSRNELAAFTL